MKFPCKTWNLGSWSSARNIRLSFASALGVSFSKPSSIWPA